MAEVDPSPPAPAVSSPASSSSSSSSSSSAGRPTFPSISLRIWPPTQRTRDAVLRRLVEILTSPSTLSSRFGTHPVPDADALARRVESEAFAAAECSDAASAECSTNGEGMETLQVYSREISRRMLDAAKALATPRPLRAAPEPPSPSSSSQAA